MPISDEEALKKENISIESSTKEFDENSKKINDLKNKIEKEILELDKTYDKVYKETTKSFELKHEKLTKEENDLKEKLQIEVTKIKEKLEEYLSISNELIKNIEKINKGIKILEKEEKNMIKTLSYISKINKNEKEMKKLSQELMKNIKISFIEEENNIKYEEYYFNGILPPKDIQFKEITDTSFKIYWKNDDKLKNNNQIKYKVEIRKENENFKQVYEGNEMNCLIQNLIKNTNYEIRISSPNNILWSEIKKIKTTEFNSLILSECEKCEEYSKKLIEWTGYKSMELLYRGTRDGMTSNAFHNKCNNKSPTLSLLKCTKGFIFGGCTPISWSGIL